jgi:hypothetical protein
LFEFAERSKVAGFLASKRELNATRFSLPDELSGWMRRSGKGRVFYRERMLVSKWERILIQLNLLTGESAVFRCSGIGFTRP